MVASVMQTRQWTAVLEQAYQAPVISAAAAATALVFPGWVPLTLCSTTSGVGSGPISHLSAADIVALLWMVLNGWR
jgi:hypothetical protein